MDCTIYRSNFPNSQTNTKKLKNYLVVEIEISINVKTKNIFKCDYC